MNEMMEEINRAFEEAAQDCEREAPPELKVFDCRTLLESDLVRGDMLVDTLLSPGLSVLAGAPKAGKSWLVMDLCLCVVQGKPFWGMRTKKSKVLYLALEDTSTRLQKRVVELTDDCPENLFFATECPALGELEKVIINFCIKHMGTRLVVIDTFQKVRQGSREMSYANDYSEVSRLKKLADDMQICILLVHHTRKLADSDYMNEISGTNGIAGSADTLMVLKREGRGKKNAVFHCTGRDIEDREIKLEFNREKCRWIVRSDNSDCAGRALPPVIEKLIEYMKLNPKYEGGNTEFARLISEYSGVNTEPRALKYKMNCYRRELKENGVEYVDMRSEKERTLLIMYDPKCDTAADAGAPVYVPSEKCDTDANEPASASVYVPSDEPDEAPAVKMSVDELYIQDSDDDDRLASLLETDCPFFEE